MPVARAQKEISSKEFAEWMAYEQLSPGYPEREDAQAAVVAQTVYNMMRAKGRARPLKDFLLNFRVPERRPAEEMMMTLLSWAKAMNARRKRLLEKKARREEKRKKK